MQRLCGRFVNPLQGYSLVHVYQRRLLLYFPSTDTLAPTDNFANYLVDSLGFSPQQAVSTASKKLCVRRKINEFNFHANAVSVVGFFSSYGFDDTHVRRIVSTYPTLLTSKVEETLRPKLRYLRDQGFSKSDIIQVVYGNPRLLLSGLERGIVPALQLLRNVMGCDTRVIAVLKKSWFHTGLTKYLMKNVALRISYGIPIELIRKRLIKHPVAFMRKPEIFNEMVARVKNKWGICPNSSMFLNGIQLVNESSEEAIESKCRIFKSFGWTQSHIRTVVIKSPNCLFLSDATIKKKLNFLMNEVRLEPGFLTSNYALFTCSLEKRILPRHKILLFLKEKGLLKKNPSFNYAFSITESHFLSEFVLPFKEVHKVYAELTGRSMKMLTQEKSSEIHRLK